jgi:hypothetical protein
VVSASPDPTVPLHTPEQELEGEEVDALPVLADEAHLVRAQPVRDALSQRAAGTVMPAVQAVAVAAGGFVAGAAVVGLVHHRQRRSTALGKGSPTRRARRVAGRAGSTGQRGTGRAAELVQIVGSRSFLVDVHLLGGSGDR